MNLSDALAFTCADHFLQVHSIFLEASKPITIAYGKAIGHTSWMAKHSHFFTVLQHNQQTIVFCHENHMMYYASPNIKLNAPDGHAFLAQTCMDNDTPRLLILDVVLPVIPDPKQRGELLRSLSHTFPGTCHIQWAGEVNALRKFLSKGLPHEVECIISLHGPLEITREYFLDLEPAKS